MAKSVAAVYHRVPVGFRSRGLRSLPVLLPASASGRDSRRDANRPEPECGDRAGLLGDGGALFLAARERDSALAHHGLIARRKAFDIGGEAGDFGRAPDLLTGFVAAEAGGILQAANVDGESAQRRTAFAKDVPLPPYLPDASGPGGGVGWCTSVARGDDGPDSDLDFLVVVPDDVPEEDLPLSSCGRLGSGRPCRPPSCGRDGCSMTPGEARARESREIARQGR